MPKTLDQLIASTQSLLLDDGTRYPSPTCETALRQALHDLNLRLPRYKTASLPVIPGQSEYNLSELTDLTAVHVVLTDDDYTPFDSYLIEDTPFIRLHTPLTTGDLTIVYKTAHTIQDLDEAATGSLPPAHEATLLDLAAGYACVIRAGGRIEANNLVGDIPEQILKVYRTWLAAFEFGLASLARTEKPPSGKKNTHHWSDRWENF